MYILGIAMNTQPIAVERINLRASIQAKQVIEQAAQLIGTNLSAFMLNQVVVLANADRDAILDALENPRQPSQALRDLKALAK